MNRAIRQHDKTDCAAACIASIAKHYGREIPLAVIREASGTSAAGTSVKGIMDAAWELGFRAKGYKSEDKDMEALRALNVPVILHTVNKFGDLHFVVLYKTGKTKATVMDPSSGSMKRVKLSELKKEWSGFLVTMEPDPDNIPAGGSTAKRHPLFRFIGHLSPGDYFLMLAASLVYIVAGICTALFLQHIIDDVLPGNDLTNLAKVGCLMLAIMVCTLCVGYGRVIYALRAGIKLDASLTLNYIRHLFSLPVGFFTKRGAGELNSRIGDIAKIRSFITNGIASVAASILILTVSFTLMFTYHSRLATMMLMFIPVYLVIYIVADRINRRVNRDIIENSAAFEEKTVESINAVKVIKYFGIENTFCRDIEKQYVKLADLLYKGGRYAGRFDTWSDAAAKLMTVVLITAGSLFIFRGELSVGELVSFYSLTSFFSSPLSQLAGISGIFEEAKISSERLNEILDLAPEEKGSLDFPLKCGQDLVFDNVSFSYPGCPPLIDHFNLTIRSGQITAIQGESGCGKSTLASLLMRDFKVRKGHILIGGADIWMTDLEKWRDFVSIVPQDPVLMNCTILDNITCKDPQPDIERAVAILEELGMKNFVSSLPMGILSTVGERGCSLSGGQRQRIALARALYRNPQILILDEATSSLDDASQRYILSKLKRLRTEGRTIVMITHKNDNIRIADRVIDMSAHSERSIPQA